jgi:hypothetical protein
MHGSTNIKSKAAVAHPRHAKRVEILEDRLRSFIINSNLVFIGVGSETSHHYL